jgi:hypothetical protein
MKVERAPSGLKATGGALWRAVVGEFELRADERAVLAAACRVADDLDRLQAMLAAGPIEVDGSKGQTVLNPIFAEVRQQRLTLARLLSQLGLGDANAVASGLARSAAGRKLAMTRWSKGA